MECPACHATAQRDDHFCGACGRRLDEAGAHPQPCPNCGAPLRMRSNQCASHGEMDPSWLRCPYCLREGREGRLEPGSFYCARCEAGHPSIAATRLCPVCAATQPADAARCELCGADLETAPAIAERRLSATVAVPRLRPGPLAYLIETGGAQVGRAVRLHDPVTTIGRDPTSHVPVDDELASAVHATIRREPDGRYIVADHGSTNGTRVNGRELTEPRAIRDNDEIGIGTTTLALKVVRPRTRRR